MILDATCAPQDIQSPTDVRLLSEAREKLEGMQDTLQAGRTEAKPRNYREKAKREYNRFCRNRRPSKKEIRRALRQQLQYVARDLRQVANMQADSSVKLSPEEETYLLRSNSCTSSRNKCTMNAAFLNCQLKGRFNR